MKFRPHALTLHTGKYRNLKADFQDIYQNLILLEKQLHFPTQEYDSARRFSQIFSKILPKPVFGIHVLRQISSKYDQKS